MPKILIIDDVEDNLISISAVLKHRIPECGVITAKSGPEGLASAKAQLPDAILLDIKMPEMDGFEVCTKLKSDEDTKYIPVTLLTAVRTDSKSRIKGLELGADAFFTKPIDEAELTAQVKVMLRMKLAEDELRRQRDRFEELVKQRTAEIIESEERLKSFLDSDSNFITLFDSDLNCVEINKTTLDFLGKDKIDIIGKGIVNIFPMLAEKGRYDRYSEVIRKGEPLIIDDIIMPERHGHGHGNVHLSVRAFRAYDGGLGMIITDITDRKQAEEALKKSEGQLRQAQKMEAVGQLAGGIAHDFNNLLTAIMGYSEMLIMDSNLNTTQQNYIEEIKKSSERAASLTRQLLAFSRKQMLQPKILNLNTLIANIKKMLRRLIGENISLKSKLNSGLGMIKADPGQIEQVIVNLAVNAQDVMPKGGELKLATKNIFIDEKFSMSHPSIPPGGYVMLLMRDTGHGMDEETKKHIFEPFFTTKKVGKGTGLGLSTVYGIVKQSNGYIFVESELKRGTTFKIYFPRVDEVVEPSTSPTRQKNLLKGTETILIVEDDRAIIGLIESGLKRYGYTVIKAENGKKALQLCKKKKDLTIQLIITDVVMPVMGGRELVEHLEQDYPEMKVLYISGYFDDTTAHHGRDEKVELLQKPFSPSSLARKVREVLDKG